MKRAVRCILSFIISTVMVLQPAAAIPALAVQELSVSQDTDVSYRSDELLVLTEKNTSRGEINEMADDAGVDVESVNVLSDGTKMVSIDTQDSDSAAVAADLGEEDKTMLVQPNYKYRLSGMSDKKDYGINDTYSNKLWYLGKKENNLEGGSSVEQAWNKLKKSDDQLTQNDKPLVAVIDTGVLFEHEDLGGCLQKDLCVRINDGITTTFSPYDDGDDEGHGTHVSGTIAADKNNGIGTSGIAGNRARLFCVDAMTGSGDEASFSTQDLCLSVDYAVSKGAKIINMSLGGLYRDHLLERRINDAYNKGTLCICAAGNENTDCIEGPGDAPHAISVMSHGKRGNYDTFSNYGIEKDVSAPGSDIFSTYIGSKQYKSSSGTSMAAPMVSGLAALLLSEDMSLTPEQLKNLIFTSSGSGTYSDKRASLGSYGGFGCINAENAIVNLHEMQSSDTEPETVVLNKNSVTMYEGETTYIEHEVLPASTKKVDPEYSSSDSKVASISGGVITAVSAGSARINVKCGNKSAVCHVTVKKLPYTKIDRKPFICSGSFDKDDPQSHFRSDDDIWDEWGTYMDLYKMDLEKGEKISACIKDVKGGKYYPIIIIRDDTGRVVAVSSADYNYTEKIFYGVCTYTAGKNGTFTIEAIEGSLGETLAGREYSLKLTSDKVKANPLVKINNIGALEVSWSAVDGAEGYEVRKYSSAEMNYALNNWTTEGSSIIDTGYYDGQTAYYTVTPYINTVAGILKCGESAPVKYGPDNGKESSEEGSGNGENKNSYTKKIKAPLIVGETYKTRSKTLRVRLSKLDGAKGYKVAYRNAGKRKWKNISAGAERTAVIKGVRKGQMLEIRAAGISKESGRQVTGEWSSIRRVCCKNAKAWISRKKRCLNIKFRRDKAAGYRVSYSLSKSFRKSKTVTHYSSAKNVFRIHGLKKGRKYYIKYSTVRKYKGKVYQGIMKMKKVK